MRSLLTSAMVAVMAMVVLGNTQSVQAVPADIVWVIDDSVSMAGDINEVKARIVDFDAAMIANNIDARYALVRFGGPSGTAPFGGQTVSLEQQLTDFATFNDPQGFFQNMTAPTSTQEPGSEATVLALSQVNFRQGARRNMILITDEDDDSSLADFQQADQDLAAADALFNFIGVPGVGNTNSRYGVLAANHGGSAFNILNFRNDPDPFFDNFIRVKVQEIKGGVPEPVTATLSLMALAGLGLTATRRRR